MRARAAARRLRAAASAGAASREQRLADGTCQDRRVPQAVVWKILVSVCRKDTVGSRNASRTLNWWRREPSFLPRMV